MLSRANLAYVARLAITLLHGWNLHVIIPAIGTLLMVSFLSPRLFDSPQLFSPVPVQAPTIAVLNILVALFIAAAVPEPCPAVLAIVALRRRIVPLLRVSLLTGATILVVATQGDGLVAVNSLLGLVGEALLAASVIGVRFCWVLPLIHGSTATLLGTNVFGQLSAWAWVLAVHPGVGSILLSALVYFAGLIAIAVRPSVQPV